MSVSEKSEKPDVTPEQLDVTLSADDSPFLSMADFFSLISLTLIYIAVVFAPAGALPEDAIPVLLGRTADPGQTIAADAGYVYVQLAPYAEDGLSIAIRARGRTDAQTTFPVDTADIRAQIAWLERELETGPPPTRVIMYFQSDEQRSNAHRIFNQLLDAARQRYPVSLVILERETVR